MNTHLFASENETHERDAQSTYGLRDSAPWSAMKEKRRNMNKCISPAAILCAATEKRGVHREKWHLSGRVHTPARRRWLKLCSPGRIREEWARGCASVHSMPGIPGATIRSCREPAPKNAVGRNGRCAYTRKLRYPPAWWPWILIDLFPPRGAFGRNDADLHYAIYARA